MSHYACLLFCCLAQRSEIQLNNLFIYLTENIADDPSAPVKSVSFAFTKNTHEKICSLNEPYQPLDIPPWTQSGRNHNFQNEWFTTYPWLHFDSMTKSIFCFICVQALGKKLVKCEKNHETNLVIDGYKNWKKIIIKLKSHDKSAFHKESFIKLEALKKNTPIISLLSEQTLSVQIQNQIALKTIITSALYLARQGIAFRAHDINEGNFIQLLRLRENDIPELKLFLKHKKSYNSSDIQNEILRIISHDILRKIIKIIKKRGEYSLIVDETNDVQGKEQVSISIRSVDEDTLEIDEFFLGLYDTHSMTGESLYNIIKDMLIRFDLSMDLLRGQCYDGGSNMTGIKNGVKSRVLADQPMALFIHCSAHSLNLAVQDSSKRIPLIRDCLQWVNDIGVIVKESPKRSHNFHEIAKAHGIEKTGPRPLCPTRWTIRHTSLSGVINTYPAVLDFLFSLASCNDDIGSKARGLYDQLSKGSIYFGIRLSYLMFSLTDQLSNVLQSETQTVAGAKEAVELVLESLKKKRSEQFFNEMWKDVKKKIKEMNLEEPSLPRKREIPKKFLYKPNESEHKFTSIEEYFRKTFYEVIDGIINGIELRFSQPGFLKYLQIEKIVILETRFWDQSVIDILKEYEFVEEKVKREFDFFRELIPQAKCLNDFVIKYKNLNQESKKLFPNLRNILKLLLVIPATSATAERSFSMLRRIKTYLRSTMTQERLNHVCIINTYPEIVDEIDIQNIMATFINSNDFRIQHFGKIKK
jgi:hypothetical protein